MVSLVLKARITPLDLLAMLSLVQHRACTLEKPLRGWKVLRDWGHDNFYKCTKKQDTGTELGKGKHCFPLFLHTLKWLWLEGDTDTHLWPKTPSLFIQPYGLSHKVQQRQIQSPVLVLVTEQWSMNCAEKVLVQPWGFNNTLGCIRVSTASVQHPSIQHMWGPSWKLGTVWGSKYNWINRLETVQLNGV